MIYYSDRLEVVMRGTKLALGIVGGMVIVVLVLGAFMLGAFVNWYVHIPAEQVRSAASVVGKPVGPVIDGLNSSATIVCQPDGRTFLVKVVREGGDGVLRVRESEELGDMFCESGGSLTISWDAFAKHPEIQQKINELRDAIIQARKSEAGKK